MTTVSAIAPPKTARPRWKHARRILAVRVDNLGDVLMTTPALAAIRESAPDAHLALMASPSGSALAPHLPWIDELIAVRAPWVKHAEGTSPDAIADIGRLVEERRYDAGIIFTTYTQSALPAATVLTLSGVPNVLAHVRENPYALVSDWVADPEPELARHEVERQLALVATAGFATSDPSLRFTVLPQDRETARGALMREGVRWDRPFVLVHPGATAPSRRYPAEQLGAAIRLLQERVAVPIIYAGIESERELIEAARRHAGPNGAGVSYAGQLSLGETAAMIADAQIVLCNNSAPSHLAAAVGTPVVTLYALTNPQHTPWTRRSRVLSHDVPCRNCLKSICPLGHHACLRGIEPIEVAEAADDLIAKGRAGLQPYNARGATPREAAA